MKGIVFDLFHTLVDPEDFRPPQSFRIRHIAEEIDADGRDLIMYWKDTYDERTTKPVSGTDLIMRYAAENGIEVSEVQKKVITSRLGDYQDVALERPRADVLAAVSDLAATYPLSVLSNCYIEEVAAWTRSPLKPIVADAVFSYAIGARKPDPAAYRAATDAVGLEPGTCAFVGNGGSNELQGARDAGFGIVVHQNQFNAVDGLVSEQEQARRAAQADAQIHSLAELAPLLG
jgi:FMN phosphatase YigB (HAD superfamily)